MASHPLTGHRPNGTIAAMFRRKKEKEAPTQVDMPQQAAPATTSGGYVVTEIPTYHGLKRKVVVYTSDANGRIIKKYKK